MATSLDLLKHFAEHAAEAEKPINGPEAIASFFDAAKANLERALNNPIMVHGGRTELMFEMLVASLGGYRVLKAEDNGTLHSKHPMRVPDFRIVCEDSTQWLIEVKNKRTNINSLQNPIHLMSNAYRETLEAYAKATGAELKIAVFWSGTGLWTLLSPGMLKGDDGVLRISFLEALQYDEMGKIGDRNIGTEPPLRMRFIADPTKERTITENGDARFTIGQVRVFSNERLIEDRIELEMAWFLINYGEWEEATEAIIENGILEGIEFRWEPHERANPDERFEIIGRFSRMLARYYSEQTIKDNAVVQLRAKPRPEWIAPFLDNQRKQKSLPLWQFTLQPNYSKNSTS